MKAKYALIALLAITFWGCDDNTAGLGLGMFPGSDQNINGKLSTFDVITESVHAGKLSIDIPVAFWKHSQSQSGSVVITTPKGDCQ